MVFYKWSKVKNKKYLQIARSIKKEGKSTHKILEHLGTANKLLIRLKGEKNEQ